MKKLFVCFGLLSLLLLPLCGCFSGAATTAGGHKYLISAIGFDYDEEITVTIEAVAVNSEDAAGKKRILIGGSGKTPEEAMKKAQQKATQPFDLSHCGAIIIGEGIKGRKFDEICDYCYDTDEITFSVYMVAAENAEKLLKPDPVSSVAVGYDIMSMLDREEESTHTDFKNSLYEVTAEKEGKKGVVALPFLQVSQDYREIISLKIFDLR